MLLSPHTDPSLLERVLRRVVGRVGVMLWIDFPSFYKFTPKAKERMRRELEWVCRDFNHPPLLLVSS